MRFLQQFSQLTEVLQPGDVLLFNLGALCSWHNRCLKRSTRLPVCRLTNLQTTNVTKYTKPLYS
ncbi:hypothetical protein HG66A1_20530 [Gimesia chilikensis]|uniref:Uncharacterized protein n=1 Tax=Gimesia chilikensis TaxID=2605989 RepID=A0A517PLL8_9PLAN|nr:hypothetical protein HG66A1_20530 [Gimesia chilikensis]